MSFVQFRAARRAEFHETPAYEEFRARSPRLAAGTSRNASQRHARRSRRPRAPGAARGGPLDADPLDPEPLDPDPLDPDRLRALLDRFEHHELPVDLAVIPAALDEGLASELRARADTQRLGLHQHGFAHRNHEPEGRKYEFGPHRTVDEQRRDIEAGAARLADLLGDLVRPIFTPPWNRCTVDTAAELGFRVLSRESRATPLEVAGLDEVPIRIDFVKPDRAGRLATAVTEGGPIGGMFHHPVDDLTRADELLALVATHPRMKAGAILDVAARVPFAGWRSSDSVSRRSGDRVT